MANFGVGGLASAVQLMEISHTHFWTKDMMDNMEHGLTPSAATTAPASRDVSPYSSRENLAGSQPAYRLHGPHSLQVGVAAEGKTTIVVSTGQQGHRGASGWIPHN